MASKEVAQYSMLQFCQLQNAYFSVQKLIYFLSFTANIVNISRESKKLYVWGENIDCG